MGLYQCDNCGCKENTACGWYHGRNSERLAKPEILGKKLCSTCAPTEFTDGSKTEFNGKWPDRFKRVFFEKGMYITNREGNLEHKLTKELAKTSNGSDVEFV